MEMTAKKINVLFIIVQMKMGGSEHLVWDLVRNLDRRRFSPHVAWFYENEPLSQFVELQIPLFHIPKTKRFDFSTMRALGKIIKDNRIDVVNAHHFLSLIYAFYGCKLVNRIGLIYTEHSSWEIQAISPKWQMVGRMVLRFTDACVGISEKVRTELTTFFKLSNDRTHTITNGVDCRLLTASAKKNDFKSKYGFPPDDIIIGMVANLKKNKNHLFLLRVFQQLQHLNKRLKLVFVGQGFAGDPEGSEEEIRRFINETALVENVFLLGSRADVPDLLKVFDIFCLTSYQEGLPLGLIEAMASGLPVVGTDVDGIRGVIEQGKNGFLVGLNDEQQLAAALQKLVEDPSLRLRFGARSREIASQNYSLEDCIEKYQRLFQDCS
jgi:glycosyltransferase involved in cell wall biosynthesis